MTSWTVALAVAAAVGLCALLGLAVLTALGSRRRGAHPAMVFVSGVFFPLTWVAWYVQDELPLTHRHGTTGTSRD